MKNRDLWDAIKSKPPRGWKAIENDLGRYMEGPKANDHMGYSRFSEVAKEERDKLKRIEQEKSGVSEPPKSVC
jgi:hypothetical protein